MPHKRRHSAGADARGPQDIIVAMFDVLGFKSIVKQRSLADINEDYRALLLLKQSAGIVPVLSLAGVDEWESASAVFSDTIVFWARAVPEEVQSFLATCSVLIAEALTAGWPLRGGIAAGCCVMDRRSRVFIGQPIVDAHLLEEAQDWIGAAMHSSCIDHPVVGSICRRDENIRKYAVPLKKPCSDNIELAVEWASRVYEPIAKLEQLRTGAGDAARKYDNAIAFVRATHIDSVADAEGRSREPGDSPA